jgi:hypothetical protein
MIKMHPTVVLFRCNSGHYFSGLACPFDGWSRTDIKKIMETIESLKKGGVMVSIETLKEHGFGEDIVKRVVIAQFGDPEAVFNGLYPMKISAKGKVMHFDKLDISFL